MLKFLSKIFGDKKDKDLKELRPYADAINVEFEKLKSISDEELRAKTKEFQGRINDYCKEIREKIEEAKQIADSEEDVAKKEDLFRNVDDLVKEEDEKIEEILEELLPEAFAVVKETARRLSENKKLEVLATNWDREIAEKKQVVSINGDKAIWHNTWNAAGAEIEWNMIHYDVQLMGGVVLHQGKIAEMATGEGKTLVATLPVYLNALPGKGVHLVTVNNYLARRDAEWNAPLFEFHGLSVDCIDLHQPNSDERRAAYNANITYGTNNEFGFDYLRDNMTTLSENLVQRKHHYAIIDEIDSVLIDEARTPLIISGPVPQGDKHEYHALKPRIEKLINAQKKLINQYLTTAKKDLNSEEKEKAEAASQALLRAHRGLPKYNPLIKFLSEGGVKTSLQKVEGYYMADKGKNMHIIDDELFFTIDEKNNTVDLTDKGRDLITQDGEDANLFVLPDMGSLIAEVEGNDQLNDDEKLRKKDELYRDFGEKSERLHTINQLVKAYALFEREVEYIVQEDKVMIVDEQTGRVLPGRRYSDGLHQAIEAKENVKVEAATQTFATVTLQNYFRMYHKLAGMTGTAETEAAEFHEIYKLDVVVVPTNRPIVRDDREDLVFKTKREKFQAVIREIEELREKGRPVLVGTTSVEVSEVLSRMLKIQKVPHNVLNAKHHQREAEIVAEAGNPGQITIATNMAGRGTDIKLGQGVKKSGGLAILGTERHDSRRVDRQLRGRAGRQGDPGSSQFFVSLEDDLMRLFGSERIAGIMDKMGLKEGEVIQHKMITRSITNAQKKVEENNFGMRKRLLEYDDVMNNQRNAIYKVRRNALFGDRIKIDLDNMLIDLCDAIAATHSVELDEEGLRMECIRLLSIDPGITQEDLSGMTESEISDKIYHAAKESHSRNSKALAEGILPGLVNLREDRPEIERVSIPFSDGSHSFSIVVDLDESIASKGNEVPDSLERQIVLSIIDEKWKDHLREMDQLRQAVQNAAIEQKDPLLVYKFEAFEIFKRMLDEVNREVISLLYKARPDIGQSRQAQQAQEQRDDFSKLRTKKEDLEQMRRQDGQHMRTNNPEGDNRPLTRRERRMQKKKKR